jgi:hypothetical protein
LGRVFFVPWADIKVERKRRSYGERAALCFGKPEIGRLNIFGHVANRIARAAQEQWPETGPLRDESSSQALFVLARAWLLGSVVWAAMAALLFWVSPPPMTGSPALILALILVPITANGVVSVLSYLRRVKR